MSDPMQTADPMQKPVGRKCLATTREGKPCSHPAGFRTEHPAFGRCFLHGGASPGGIKHAAKERAAWVEQLVAQIDPSLVRLVALRDDPSVPHSVQLAAARDILDRAGVRVGPGTDAAAQLEVVVRYPDPPGLLA